MNIGKHDTALELTGPQNDALSESGAAWPFVGPGGRENRTVETIDRPMLAATDNRHGVFASPHDWYPSQRWWRFGGTCEHVEDELNSFARKGPLTLEGFAGSGADWLERYKPYIEDGQTVVVSPHKVYGPESN